MATFAQLQATATDTFRQAVAWWLSELQAMVPWQKFRQPQNAPAILDISANAATLVLTSRRGSERFPLSSEAAQAALRGRGKGAVVIRLDTSLLLRASLTLPIAAGRSLRQIVYHQLDRVVPLPAEQVYFECHVTQRSAEARTLVAEVIVVSRDSVDRAVELARSAGLTPRLAIASDGEGDMPAVLWRADQATDLSPTQRRLRRTLEVLAVLLLLGTYGAYVYRLDEIAAGLQFEVDRASRSAGKIRELSQRHTQTDEAFALLDIRRRDMPLLHLLEQLTELVPDTMWVSQLQIRGRSIELIGYSPRVNDLVARINESNSFSNVQFRSPVTRSADGKGDRFDVSFDAWVEPPP